MYLLKFLVLILCIAGLAYSQEAEISQHEESSEGFEFEMGLSAGAVVLDGDLYNQIGIRTTSKVSKVILQNSKDFIITAVCRGCLILGALRYSLLGS